MYLSRLLMYILDRRGWCRPRGRRQSLLGWWWDLLRNECWFLGLCVLGHCVPRHWVVCCWVIAHWMLGRWVLGRWVSLGVECDGPFETGRLRKKTGSGDIILFIAIGHYGGVVVFHTFSSAEEVSLLLCVRPNLIQRQRMGLAGASCFLLL